MEIDKKIIKKTIKCEQDFVCLKHIDDSYCCCGEVINSIAENVLFVACANNLCQYKMNFGSSTICSCPTRKEIHNKYKK